MTIGIPIEIKVREYLSKMFLASKIIENSNQDVIIGEKSKVYHIFKNSRKFYLISKGGPINLFKFFKHKYPDNYLGILDEEAPLVNIGKYNLLPRIHSKILKNLDDYFIWGKKDKLLLNKAKNKKFSKLYNEFGHPKFDLLEKPNIKIFDKEVNYIKKKFKNLIFIPSSFSCDAVLGDQNFKKFQVSHFISKKKNVVNKYFNILSLEQKNYELFLSLLVEIAKTNPNYNFVFRPHPNQSIKLIKKRFTKKPKNLHIIFKYVTTPWIIACKMYIHYGCSSSLEASFLKKKIIFYFENEKEFKTRNINIFKKYGYFFNNYQDCLSFLNTNLKTNLKNVKNSKPPEQFIYNSSRKTFSENFVNYINNKYKNKIENINLKNLTKFNHNKNPSATRAVLSKLKNNIFKNVYLANLLKSIFPSLILTKEYRNKKFDKITYEEIKKTLNLIQSKTKSKTKIKISKLNNDLFLLRQKQ